LKLNLKQRQTQLSYWLNGASHDKKTAESLYKSHRFDACLFFCHLSLEKSLKYVLVKDKNIFPPRIHDLIRLLSLTSLKLEEKLKIDLEMFTSFNMEARYPEEKMDFYKLCTKEFSKKYLDKFYYINNLLWGKSKLKK